MRLSKPEILTVIRICIESQVLNTKQIVHWADSLILDSENDDYLIEISLSGSKGLNEIIHILKENETDSKNEMIWKTIYGLAGFLFKKRHLALKESCYMITKTANEFKNETEYDLFGMGLDDSFYLASKKIYGNLIDTENRFKEYTSPYINIGEEFWVKELKTKPNNTYT